MKTVKEILEDVETLIYNQGGRALDDGDCSYIAPDGKICGHSMAIREEMRKECIGSSASNVIKLFGDDVHKPEYRGHISTFWSSVQSFHDYEEHWDHDNRLTEDGKSYKDRIIKTYSSTK